MEARERRVRVNNLEAIVGLFEGFSLLQLQSKECECERE